MRRPTLALVPLALAAAAAGCQLSAPQPAPPTTTPPTTASPSPSTPAPTPTPPATTPTEADPPASAIDPRVTQANIATTICAHPLPDGATSWSAEVRPPVSYTQNIERQILAARGEDYSHNTWYQVDHHVPLELGGSPTDYSNFQLLLNADHTRKTWDVDNPDADKVCDGTMSLAEARRRSWDWTPGS